MPLIFVFGSRAGVLVLVCVNYSSTTFGALLGFCVRHREPSPGRISCGVDDQAIPPDGIRVVEHVYDVVFHQLEGVGNVSAGVVIFDNHY